MNKRLEFINNNDKQPEYNPSTRELYQQIIDEHFQEVKSRDGDVVQAFMNKDTALWLQKLDLDIDLDQEGIDNNFEFIGTFNGVRLTQNGFLGFGQIALTAASKPSGMIFKLPIFSKT